MNSLSRTVLIVEDEKDIRDTLQQVLELEGYVAHAASNGREAIAMLKEGRAPGLILLDLMRPVMNGWEFLEHHHADPVLSKIPVVLVSAAGDRAKDLKVSAFLRKPVELDHLLKVVQSYFV